MISPAAVKATDGGARKYDLNVNQLQEGIQIAENAISGKLKEIQEYPGFGGEEARKPGHYLALDVTAPSGATVTTKIEGGTNDKYVDLTEDGFCVYRIKNNTQKIKIKTEKDGEFIEKTYALTKLTLEHSEA